MFSSASLQCSFKKTFLSLFAILWNSAFSWLYLSLFPLPFLLFSAICKASSDTTLLLAFVFLWGGFGHNLQCYEPPSIVLQALQLPNLIPWIYLSLLLFSGGSDGKASACNTGDLSSIPGLGRSPEKGLATHSSTLAWKIPWTVAWQALLPMGILQARILEWVACPLPGDLPDPGIELRSPVLQVDSLPSEPQGKPPKELHSCILTMNNWNLK